MSHAFLAGGMGSPIALRDADTRGRGSILLARTWSRTGVQRWFLDRPRSQRVGVGVWGSVFLPLGGEPGSRACCDLVPEPDGPEGLLLGPALRGFTDLSKPVPGASQPQAATPVTAPRCLVHPAALCTIAHCHLFLHAGFPGSLGAG